MRGGHGANGAPECPWRKSRPQTVKRRTVAGARKGEGAGGRGRKVPRARDGGRRRQGPRRPAAQGALLAAVRSSREPRPEQVPEERRELRAAPTSAPAPEHAGPALRRRPHLELRAVGRCSRTAPGQTPCFPAGGPSNRGSSRGKRLPL